MKKLLMLMCILCLTVTVFAQDKPAEAKPKSEIYGKFRLDYDFRETYLDLPHPTYNPNPQEA